MVTTTLFATADESCNSTNFNTKLDANFSTLSTTSTTTRAGAGAVPITHAICEVTTDGADALTLADGAEGQHLFVILVGDSGDATLTPANAGGWTTITFADAGDSAHLLFTNGSWYLVGQGGLTTGPLTA